MSYALLYSHTKLKVIDIESVEILFRCIMFFKKMSSTCQVFPTYGAKLDRVRGKIDMDN